MQMFLNELMQGQEIILAIDGNFSDEIIFFV